MRSPTSSNSSCRCFFFLFFFQAEDGIRDYKVTGVQTCALPISVTDSLTGLFNRRCIAESLTMELLTGGNPHARVGVILIDVDHFKRFNDTWGHGGGDALLQQLARLMRDTFTGDDDIVCRYGGEEFLI